MRRRDHRTNTDRVQPAHGRPPDVTDRLATIPYAQSPQFMCLILAVIAIATPVLIVLFRGVIQKGGRLERDELLKADSQ